MKKVYYNYNRTKLKKKGGGYENKIVSKDATKQLNNFFN